ncbi:hypothetical protein HG537_0D00150 [Torulaspora globosa]|uniref:Arsenical-resistance protein n=1 Tax=Torulaspora globosa TaxID=48254 RepID=A0A7H9HUC1_9SACH|nr:hypothetical protein HG537_0D00150 [Torulaspora sp. CBS 2947]
MLAMELAPERSRWGVLLQTAKRLSVLDLLLPFTILLCIIIGVVISVYVPSSRSAFDPEQHGSFVGVSIPLAIGMIVMMVPPICKVPWESIHVFLKRRYVFKQLMISFVLNWLVGPFLMTALSWMVLFKFEEYRQGIIMIGVARCIAMVLIWNQIAGGDNDLCVIIVVMNSLLQMILYAPMATFLCYVISGQSSPVSNGEIYQEVAKSVGAFLGIPIAVGIGMRLGLIFMLGKQQYEKKALKFISPWAMIGFHYTLLVIFISRGYQFIHQIGQAILCFIPLILYFLIAWFVTFGLMRLLSADKKPAKGEKCDCDEALLSKDYWGKDTCSANYATTMTQCFTMASNNFELSLAVAISLYGNDSKQAIAATFGPLLEVPVLLLLALQANYFKRLFIWKSEEDDKLVF